MCVVASSGVLAGCGDDVRFRPDAGISIDAAAPAPDAAPLPDPAPVRPHATIRVYPDGFPYTGVTESATLLAVQDGDGPWQTVTSVDGVYRAEVTGTRYAVAVICSTDHESSTRLYYQAMSDTPELHALGCAHEAGRAHVSIEVAGFRAPQHAEVWVGRGSAVGNGEGRVDLDVRPGTPDYLVKSYDVVGIKLVPLKLYRGSSTLNLGADRVTSVAPVDLALQGAAPEHHPLALVGHLKSEGLVIESGYATPHSEIAWPIVIDELVVGEPTSYATIGAEGRRPEDVSNLTVTASRTSELENRAYVRVAQVALAAPGPARVELPASWTLPTPTVDRATVPHATVVLPLGAPALARTDYHVVLETTGGPILVNTIELFVRPSWAEGAATATITTPDLSALPGWTSDLALRSGVPVEWTATRIDRSLADDALPVDGRVILENRVSGKSFPTR